MDLLPIIEELSQTLSEGNRLLGSGGSRIQARSQGRRVQAPRCERKIVGFSQSWSDVLYLSAVSPSCVESPALNGAKIRTVWDGSRPERTVGFSPV
jgi:hypothetical protein